MKTKTIPAVIAITFYISIFSNQAFCLPKDFDIEKILEENNIVLKGMKKLGLNPIEANRQMLKSIEPKKTIGENVPRKCIDKQRSLGNGIIKCKNGYFQDE